MYQISAQVYDGGSSNQTTGRKKGRKAGVIERQRKGEGKKGGVMKGRKERGK